MELNSPTQFLELKDLEVKIKIKHKRKKQKEQMWNRNPSHRRSITEEYKDVEEPHL